MKAVVLVAHGSADPRAAATTRALVRAVAALRPGLDVRASFLDHRGPRPGEVLFALQGHGYGSVSLVPLLLTSAYHGRVDLPAVLASARAEGLRLSVSVGDVLGPVEGSVDPLLVRALRRRIRGDFDGVALLAAGTRDDPARSTVDLAADALGARLGVPCVAGFAGGSPMTGAAAVEALRAKGCRRIVGAAYFLACGRLYDTVSASALSAGALSVAEPLGDAVDLARLVLTRAEPLGDAVDLARPVLTRTAAHAEERTVAA